MRPNKRKFLAATLVALALQAAADGPTDYAPWTVPLYNGDPAQTHRAPARAAPASPVPEARDLWTRALACWPLEKVMDLTVSLEGRARNVRGSDFENQNRAWVGVVAKIPLYNGGDVERERQREFMRRTKAAESVGALLLALTDVERVDRQAALTRALERRAQERVRLGVAETGEQVAYLEKAAALESDRLRHESAVQRARLELLSLCVPERIDALDDFIRPYVDRRRR